MPQIKPSLLGISLILAFALAGCGNKNDKAAFSPDSGHPADWTTWVTVHKASGKTEFEPCNECHGESLAGGIAQTGCFSTSKTTPNGFACHAANPLVNLNCTSCHGTPPNSTIFPNRANAHAIHMALTEVACSSCHAGAGSGTANHAKTVTVSIPDNLKANTVVGTFGYNAVGGTCSAVICHGGKVSLSWIGGGTDCVSCHEQGTASRTPQFNSFYTGTFPFPDGTVVNLHQFHLSAEDPTSSLDLPITCTSCHNTDKLAPLHFNGLTTPGFEGSPGSTLGGGSTNITTYNPFTSGVPSGRCTTSCHAIRFWIN